MSDPADNPALWLQETGELSHTETPVEQKPKNVAAEKLGLPLHLEVVWDSEAHQTHIQLVSGERFYETAAEHWMKHLPWFMGFALGIYASLITGQVFIACMILVNWLAIIRLHWSIGKSALNKGIQYSTMRMSFVFTEEGFCETDRGVESRVPWSSMSQWYLWRSILFIELSNGHWAVLPARNMKPKEVSLEFLTSYLKIKGVPGLKLKDG